MITQPIVVALGGHVLDSGNSFLDYPELEPACKTMAKFASEGLVVTHGNGPQIGRLAQFATTEVEPSRTLDVLNAETEGLLGYLVEQQLANHLTDDVDVSTLLTRVEVAINDPAFEHPGKPIGNWISAGEKQKLAKQHDWKFVEHNKQYKRIVPSPKPLRTLQLKAIKTLLNAGNVVICAGGGGIPVSAEVDGVMHGTEAVIDKDHSSSLIARELNARLLVFATEVDGVYENWQEAAQTKI